MSSLIKYGRHILLVFLVFHTQWENSLEACVLVDKIVENTKAETLSSAWAMGY